MRQFVRPLVISCALVLTGLVQAAPAAGGKAAKTAKPEPAPRVEIDLAHNLGAMGEDRLQEVVDRFNRDSKLGTVRLARTGEGAPTATLNLVRRYDLDDVLYRPGGFVPLYKVMAEAKENLRLRDLSPDVLAGVTDDKGRLVALPVAYSTPVLFYNKAAFRKAGLNPEQAPRTWAEMQAVLDKLQEADIDCPYTTAWPTWVHIDNVAALSGAPATEKGTLQFNGLAHIKHIAMMTTWQKAGYFRSFGRHGEANAKFQDGTCATITTDSWEHTAFRTAPGIELGVAPLPHHDDLYGGRQHTLADGASIWVGGGRKPAEYKLAARFIAFLMSPEMQIAMPRTYGQLPMTEVARQALDSAILRDQGSALKVAYASMAGRGAQPPLRVANINSVRIIVDEELEAVWSNRKPAKAALDTAVQRGNAVLAAKPFLKKGQPF